MADDDVGFTKDDSYDMDCRPDASDVNRDYMMQDSSEISMLPFGEADAPDSYDLGNQMGAGNSENVAGLPPHFAAENPARDGVVEGVEYQASAEAMGYEPAETEAASDAYNNSSSAVWEQEQNNPTEMSESRKNKNFISSDIMETGTGDYSNVKSPGVDQPNYEMNEDVDGNQAIDDAIDSGVNDGTTDNDTNVASEFIDNNTSTADNNTRAVEENDEGDETVLQQENQEPMTDDSNNVHNDNADYDKNDESLRSDIEDKDTSGYVVAENESYSEADASAQDSGDFANQSIGELNEGVSQNENVQPADAGSGDRIDISSVKQEINNENSQENDKSLEVTEANASSADDGTPEKADEDKSKSSETSSGDGPVSKPSKQQECVVCKRVAKCKYNIVRNGDTRHLCDDNCFKVFRQQPTAYLHSDRTAPPENCDECKELIPADNKLKFIVKAIPGKVNKHFCQESCMENYRQQTKFCTTCERDIQTIKPAFFLPINNGAEFKDFCSHNCMKRFEKSTQPLEPLESEPHATRTSSRRGRGRGRGEVSLGPASSRCVTCGKGSSKKHGVELTYKGRLHRFCSEPCAASFRAFNRLDTSCCQQCGSACPLDGATGTPDGAASLQIQFEGETRRFCSTQCLSAFKVKRQRAVACVWCGARKSNFDMVERIDANSKFQQFCSLNCLSLYRVNLQANSKLSVACDHCRKCAPAQYHLTMSDASVRNFCGYNCVMAFQAQFSQPVLSSDLTSTQHPTPGQQVTPNTANSGSTANTRISARSAAKATKSLQPKTPVISNIVSLASMQKGQHQSVSTQMEQQIIIQPPPPKQLKNKALLCKPLQQTKATSCRPTTISKGTQTEESWKPHSTLLPVPVPMFTPAPMTMYSATTPFPIFIPVPIPIPCFVPTTKKSAKGIMKKIKEMQDRMPSDPFEAELLMMAEAVANAGKDSDSDSDDNDNDDDGRYDDSPAGANDISTGGVGGGHAPGSSELAEDMLQMALRMASEMPDEPILDLEDAVDPTPVPRREVAPVSLAVANYGTLDKNSEVLNIGQQTPRINRAPAVSTASTPKTKRKSSGGGNRRSSAGSTANKRAKLDVMDEPPAQQPAAPEPPADANMVLKFTYGVNAYKHWAMQKNAALERSAAMGGAGLNLTGPRYLPGSVINGRVRPFKLDILQCTAEELNFSLCMFVKEVHKPNGEEYAPDSIYYLCLGIQEYIYENGRIDNIFTDLFYERFTDCLNEVLTRYEVRLNTQGLLVCRIEEEHLWECKQLGAHSPHVLLNTLVYFNTKHFMLRSTNDHLGLSFSHIMKHWKKTTSASGKQGRSVYLRYYAPAQAQGDAAQKQKKKEDQPVFEQCENTENPLRCPVKLYEFYLSKCPESIKSRNDVFYLVPERSCVPDSPVWYSTQSLGAHPMNRMLNRLNTVREVQESQLGAMQPYYN